MKRFLSMKDAVQQLVQSAEYTRYDFETDPFAAKFAEEEVWDLMARITKTAGPILLLLRLADTNAPTLSKLKGTVDYVSELMEKSGDEEDEDTLEDRICTAFHNRVDELECDIVNAAYILDPTFVKKSRHATSDTMLSFWKVARAVLRVQDDHEWRRLRMTLVSELASYRMKTGGFSMEDYSTPNACEFWGAAGCHAPTLKKLAFRLTSLPCSSGEAERNWQEVKLNMTKKRNRLHSSKLERMVFVRRFNHLKRRLFEHDTGKDAFKKWVQQLLSKATTTEVVDVDDDEEPDDKDIFQDHIEKGEQGKINGREPGEPRVMLTELKKDNAAKSWLFEKYYNLCFVDRPTNPESDDAEVEPLPDENEWEHMIIKNIVWWKTKGFSVETALYGETEESHSQSFEKYLINSKLHEMIRDSPHNTRQMASEIHVDT